MDEMGRALILSADFRKRSDGGIDFIFSIEITEAEADGAGWEGPERLVGIRRAVQADPGHDAVFEVQSERRIRAVDIEGLYRYYSRTAFNAF